MLYLKDSLQKVVDVLRKLKVKLKTLENRYGCPFNRVVGILLSEHFVADPTNQVSPIQYQRATVTTAEGTYITFARLSTGEEYCEGPMGVILPIEHNDIFGPLRKLKT